MTININTIGVLREDLMQVYNSAPRSDEFLARTILRPMGVRKRRGDYLRVPRASLTQRHNTKRARAAETSKSSMALDEDGFSLTEYGHMTFIPRKDKQDLEGRLDAQDLATRHCKRVIDVDTEIDVATAIINETLFPASGDTGVTLSNAWDSANGTPVDDIALGHEKFANLHGIMANALIVPWSGWLRGLSRNAQVRASLTDSYGRVKDGAIPVELLLSVLNVERIIIAKPSLVYNSANPNQTPSFTKIWNEDYALLTRIATDDFTDGPHLGRLMELDQGAGSEFGSLLIESNDQFEPAGTWVRAEYDQQVKIMPDAPGYLIKNIKA